MGRMERRQDRKSSFIRAIWDKLRSNSLFKKLLWIALTLAIIGLLVFNIFIWTSDVSKLETPVPQPTMIYDQNSEIASKISNSSIEGITIKQIPKDVIHAVISVEDQRFYKHHGVNYFGIIRALFQNAASGEVVAGGSTITQQLAKNVFLTHERTLTRKVKELILTKKIERTYTKDEIIERYLNQIYFGEGAWGIQRAAQVYFGKNASELTLSESAMLAGLIKAPSAYSPLKNFEKAVERRDIVLELMKGEGYIDQSDIDKAMEQEIVLEGRKMDDKYKGKYPYYVDYIIEEAIEKYGLTENEVLSGGLHIYTELNPVIQKNAEEVYQNESLFPKGQSDQIVQSGGIFIDSSTGGIKALVGGRGDHTFRGFNRATQLVRQPGSTMKPLAVYTPALERGYDTFDSLEDKPLNIDGYQPKNYDQKFRDQVTMYNAVIHSYNVPAVWLLDEMGMKYGVNAVERFGIPLQEDDQSLSLALGGMSEGTSPLSMAQAYTTFANDGLMVDAHAIQRIEDANGELLNKWQKNTIRVTEKEVAQKMTYMLRGVVNEGTGTKAKVSGYEIAGKTGTTQLPFQQEGAKDHWFVGYTPELTGAIWIGYDQTDETHYLSSSSGGTATAIFQKVISMSVSELQEKSFDLSLIEKKYNQQYGSMKKAEEKKQKEEERRKELEEKQKKVEEERRKELEEKQKKEEEERRKEVEKERKKEEKEKEKERKEKEKEEKKNNKDNDDEDD
ncbi:transglycosylase domain-containing protein [Niallia endozanthoxylica]|uniref:PBP1A family penicillin-binding protein n=1 Tax=Niallia endozanthoxylica TaxID=2036016 RepID=A0A5J5GWQ1_9BACI|nr:PBP1A family penicillin-binding protein [Niallia endozanthoxylica]KAA9011874.1 PBP1A family penicillin-binding protein [Niallia endozanthoxylica]